METSRLSLPMHNGRVSKRRTLNTEELSERLFKKLKLNSDEVVSETTPEKDTPCTALIIYQAPKPVISPETLDYLLKDSLNAKSISMKELMKLQELKLDLKTILQSDTLAEPDKDTEPDNDLDVKMILD